MSARRSFNPIPVALIVAMAMPLAAAMSLKSVVRSADAGLPDLAHSAVVLDRNGILLRPFPVADGRWRLPTTIADVDPAYVAMLLAYEDRRFHRHRGVDLRALARSMVTIIANGRFVSGGSTLTMQVARLIDGNKTRTPAAKFRQIVHARALEDRHDKAAILTHYLNRAPFGGNLEGVRTAALAYFGKEPLRLSAAEAALLVALPQSPEARRPDRPAAQSGALKKARDRVLKRAHAIGLIDRRELQRALTESLPAGRRPMPILAAHLSEIVVAEKPERAVHTLSLDADLQAKLETLARNSAQRLGPNVSVAILVADHRTGEIRASVGSSDYFDPNRRGFVDMTRAVRSPGSTLKPLIYGLAFQDGVAHPESLIEDRPSVFHGYQPANFDRDYLGTVTVRKALQLSLNVPAVRMLEKVGPARLLAALRRTGAEPVLPASATANLSVALGGIGMRLTDLVSLYSALAAGGRSVPLTHDTSDAVGRPPAETVRILNPQAAWLVGSILAGVRDPNGMTPGGFAFKTGTSYGYRDAWAIGFDGRHVAGVWAGRADGKSVNGLVGIDVAAPILDAVFARIGESHRLPPAPPGTTIASSADLPMAMRHIGAAGVGDPPDKPGIVFPPHLSQVEIASGSPLAIEVEHGRAPLTLMINGVPVTLRSWGRNFEWIPEGRGSFDLLVIDARGQTARSTIFLR